MGRTITRSCAAILAALAVWAGAAVAPAQDMSGFQAFIASLGQRAIAEGVRPATVASALSDVQLVPRVIELDRAQPGADPNAPIPEFAPYARRHVDPTRIARGRAAFAGLAPQLARIEAETGVPAAILVAIWGHETNYGQVRGNFDLLNALGTLAWEGRRRELFATEFVATLKMLDRGYPRAQLKGSWAGATGHPQFLPSVYLRMARDGDGDGRADIWNSEADALASIANYFRAAGWRPGLPWGSQAIVPASLDREAIRARTVSPRCPRVHARLSRTLTIAEWRRLGVVASGRNALRDYDMASLIEPDGPGTQAYLLTGNYRAILEYNCSNFYALSVGLLADAIAR